MGSDIRFVEHIMDQLRDVGDIRYRKMFGEYAIYSEDKVVALVCDDQLFVKPTDAGRELIGEPVMAPPYQGAKPYFLIDSLDDSHWLTRLIRVTAAELPIPKPRKKQR